MEKSYKCPFCHTSHPIKDCEIDERFIKSKHTGSTIRGRYAVHSFIDTYRYVRLCRECAKKQKRTRIIMKILLYGIIPIAYLVIGLFNGMIEKNGIVGTLLLVLVVVFVCSIVNAIINRLLEHSVYDIDYEKAYDDNALLTSSEIYDYQHNKEK